MDLKPVGSYVALQLLGVDDEDPEEKLENKIAASVPNDSEESYNELVYAIVLGVGPDAQKGIKKGQTVLARKCVHHSLRVGDDVVITDSWNCVSVVNG